MPNAMNDIDELQASLLRTLASAHRLRIYQLSDPQILDACGLMRAVLVRRLSRLGDLAAAVHDPAITFAASSQEGHP